MNVEIQSYIGQYLNWKFVNSSHFFEKKGCHRTCCIPLISIMFNHKALLQFWPMVFLMFVREVRVHTMCHICRHWKNGSPNYLQINTENSKVKLNSASNSSKCGMRHDKNATKCSQSKKREKTSGKPTHSSRPSVIKQEEKRLSQNNKHYCEQSI